ncbi:MAG: YihY/virulence factor BrkB family protein [Undibacterium sp.]|nr:YihY/virulence factor BrkB family protein [Opitutaceae bacterium]
MSRLAQIGHRFSHLYRKEIWSNAHLKDNSPRGWLYATLRVISITTTVFSETKIASRAAALSFSSLLGLGPLVAIAVLVGGFVLGNNENPNLVADKLGQLIKFVAPQITQYEHLSSPTANRDPAAEAVANAANPELVTLINGIITGARSGSAGAFGVLSLILIVLLLFKSVEDAFNDIWGVRLGRSLLMRVVFYWTVLTLGAVLFFASLALLGASAFINVFMERLPMGTELLHALSWALPVFSFTLLVGLLVLFYRVIPNTHVFWRAALIGAIVVGLLIVLNNFVAFLYVRRVILTKNLYGSLGILPVLMLGLYIFWLYVLIGGVISYAVQNVHFRNSQAAWSNLTESMRERLSLVVLLTIGRRFQNCLPPTSASQLGDLLKVPTQILNECLNRLVLMKLITTLRPAMGTTATEYLYQPSRPLSRISLLEFKILDDNFGDDPVGQTLERIDPILHHYNQALESISGQVFFKKSLEELYNEYPFDESRPPFTTLT